MRAAMLALADRVEADARGPRLGVRSLWGGLHAVADSNRHDYAQRVGVVFAAMTEAAGCSQTWLGDKLRSLEPVERAAVVRAAAAKLEDDA